jgi:hypothetical protein
MLNSAVSSDICDILFIRRKMREECAQTVVCYGIQQFSVPVTTASLEIFQKRLVEYEQEAKSDGRSRCKQTIQKANQRAWDRSMAAEMNAK